MWTPIMTDLVASGVPYRDTFWNIPTWARIFVYVGGTAAIAAFAWGCWLRVALWAKGKPERRLDRLPERVTLVLTHVLGQARVLSQAYPGIMHAIVFWGFLALLIGTILATIDYDITLPLFHMKLLKGNFYLFYELVLDMFGLFFVIGLGMACWRRFVVRPARIEPAGQFAYALLILFVINLTGFVMEACRLAVVRPAWAAWSPVGYLLGEAMVGIGLGEPSLRAIHISLWLFHAAIAFIFIALIPWSYFMHLVTPPINVFFAKLAPRGELAKIENIEEAENLGVGKFEDFSWKRRLDFDTCVEL